jgi:hypothetical protein
MDVISYFESVLADRPRRRAHLHFPTCSSPRWCPECALIAQPQTAAPGELSHGRTFGRFKCQCALHRLHRRPAILSGRNHGPANPAVTPMPQSSTRPRGFPHNPNNQLTRLRPAPAHPHSGFSNGA